MDLVEMARLAETVRLGVDRLVDENATLRGEVDALQRVADRLDKKLAEEYVKTMKLEAALSRYREAVGWALSECESHPEWRWSKFQAELKRRAGEGE